MLIVAILEAWSAGFFAWKMPRTLAQFTEIFKNFGADLPAATRFVIATPLLWWLFAVVGVGLVLWIAVRNRVPRNELARMKRAMWMFGALLGVTVAFTVCALYFPLFELAKAV
jgi:type II secretory pathway component PulF